MPEERRNAADQGLSLTGRVAVFEAMWIVLRQIALPYTMGSVRTSATKPDPDDVTECIDRASNEAITILLRKAVEISDNPLSGGFLIVNEEDGLDRFPNPAGAVNEDLIVFVDPVDYTAAASRGLDGSVLFSVYDLREGFRAAVVGDLFRRKIYWRTRGLPSLGMSIIFPRDPTHPFAAPTDSFSPPTGEVLLLEPSGRKTLEGASVNVFLGKPGRLTRAAELGKRLWNWKKEDKKGIKNIFSVGGSLGPTRVAEGILDASVEVVKGFRPWDFAPGAFIAQGAGAAVVDLDARRLSFKWNERVMRRFITQRFRDQALDACRQKFVVAATPDLAAQIVALLRKSPRRRAKK